MAVAVLIGPVDAGPVSDMPEGRLTELVSIDEAAARALAFIDAVAVSGGGGPSLYDNTTRGWSVDGKTWYWFGAPDISATEDVYFGLYDESARDADQSAFDAPFQLVSVPAGSDRGESHDGGHYVRVGGQWAWSTDSRDADGGADGYDSIGQEGVAKNVLTIGEANGTTHRKAEPAGAARSGLTGWGPTDDGRVKPDVVANGAALFAPGGSGSKGHGGLLVQHYRATHGGADMLSSALKGLVIHTADETGEFDGPDYRAGWGKLSVSAAQQHITLDATDPDAIQELQLADGWTFAQDWIADGATPIKATICWTDPAGTPPALALDPTDAMLVNDLDLRIVGPGNTVHEPWVLDPASPDAAATRGDNARDNVEVVMIDAPDPGVYRLRVTHKGSLVNGAQDFALVLSRVDVGPPCGPDEILDCNGNCAPVAWLNDGVCDDGARVYNGNPIDFTCVEVDDGDDCVMVDASPPFIVWRNTVTSQHAMWFMDGATLLPGAGLLPNVPSARWKIAGTGDFDGDGRADLLWRDASTGQNQIWFMTGTSLVPDGRPTVTAGTAWSVAAVEDFDGDGKADILWRSRRAGNALWFMDGATLRPESGVLPSVPLAWRVAGAGDFDGDGFADVLWRHAVTGQNAIWFLGGTAMTISARHVPGVGLAWQVTGTDDFDGDGMADILWRNVVSNANAIWFMDGGTLRPETGSLPSVAAEWAVAAVADLDGDESPEIFWRNDATGQNFIWFLEGTSLVPTGAFTTSAGTAWTVAGADD